MQVRLKRQNVWFAKRCITKCQLLILSQRNPSRDCGCGLRSPFRRRCDFVCQRSRSQRRSSRRRRQNTLGSSRAAGNHARGVTTGTMRFDSVNFQYIASVNWRFIMLIKNSLILHHAKPVSRLATHSLNVILPSLAISCKIKMVKHQLIIWNISRWSGAVHPSRSGRAGQSWGRV